jgi:hypothetical protein
MTRDTFKTLFESALEVAAENADKKLGRSVPRVFEIEMHGLAPHARTLTKEHALDEVYIASDRFYRIIDLAVRRVSKDVTTVFMRVSGHSPGSFADTWNQPIGSGPFKQLLADEIEVA